MTAQQQHAFQAADLIFHKYKIKSYITLLFLDSWLFTTYSIIVSIIIIAVFIYNNGYCQVLCPKKRELSSRSADDDDSKRPREESNNSTSIPAFSGDVFEGDCVKILDNCMQNIEKQVKELFLLAKENKEKHIKGESDLSELTEAIYLI